MGVVVAVHEERESVEDEVALAQELQEDGDEASRRDELEDELVGGEGVGRDAEVVGEQEVQGQHYTEEAQL